MPKRKPRKNPYLDGLQPVERAPCGGDDDLCYVDSYYPNMTFAQLREISEYRMQGRDWFAEQENKRAAERRRKIAEELSKIKS